MESTLGRRQRETCATGNADQFTDLCPLAKNSSLRDAIGAAGRRRDARPRTFFVTPHRTASDVEYACRRRAGIDQRLHHSGQEGVALEDIRLVSQAGFGERLGHDAGDTSALQAAAAGRARARRAEMIAEAIIPRLLSTPASAVKRAAFPCPTQLPL